MKKKVAPAPSCDWRAKSAQSGTESTKPKARVMKQKGFRWRGTAVEKYKQEDGSWADVARVSLIGMCGENTKFHLRYFEIAPGGHTTLELHKHEHVVIAVRGSGECRIDRKVHSLEPLDTVYIPPSAPHQLSNPTDEPFGFFCIVDARRDRPKAIKK